MPANFPNHTAAEIQRHLQAGADTLRAYRARASLRIDSPSQSGSFSSRINHRRGDSLYMTISPGLGIEAMRILVTPDSFFVYNRLESELTYGGLTDAASTLPAALTVSDPFENLTGTLTPPPYVDWNVDADSAYYYLREGGREYVIDPTVWRVVQYQEHDLSGNLVDERSFSEFDRFGGLYLPRRIVFRRPQEETTAALYYRELTLNPGELGFDLRVSSSADRRRVGSPSSSEQP